MSDTKHTPGPWEFDKTNVGREYSSGYGITQEGAGATIAHVPSDSNTAEADGRLIAAAPEMAALLLSAWQHVSHGGPRREDVAAVLRKAGLIPGVCGHPIGDAMCVNNLPCLLHSPNAAFVEPPA